MNRPVEPPQLERFCNASGFAKVRAHLRERPETTHVSGATL